VSNDSVASIDPTTGALTGLALGTTEVFAEDTRVDTAGDHAVVRVVMPKSLHLEISWVDEPGALVHGRQRHLPYIYWHSTHTIVESRESLPWPLVNGRLYRMEAVVLDKTGHKVILTKGTSVDFGGGNTSPEEKTRLFHMETIPDGEGGSLVDIARGLRAIVDGVTEVSATVRWGTGKKKEKTSKLSVLQKVQVCGQMQTWGEDNATLRLPAYPPDFLQPFVFRTLGGCAAPGEPAVMYTLRSADPTVISPPGNLPSPGPLIVTAEDTGSATITLAPAHDLYQWHNAHTVATAVTAAVAAAPIGPSTLHLEVGRRVQLLTALENSGGERFHNCSAAHVQAVWSSATSDGREAQPAGELVHLSKTEVSAEGLVEGACAGVWMEALAPTRAPPVTVKATILVDGIFLKATWQVRMLYIRNIFCRPCFFWRRVTFVRVGNVKFSAPCRNGVR
jgi:hypothetical protein